MESVKIVTPASVKHRNLLQSIDGMLYLVSFVALIYLMGQGRAAVPYFYLWSLLCLVVCGWTFFRLFKLRGRYGKPVVLGRFDVGSNELAVEKEEQRICFEFAQVKTIQFTYTGYANWRGRSWKGDMNYVTIVPAVGEPLEFEIQLPDKVSKDRFKKELKAFCDSGKISLKVVNRTALNNPF